MLSGSGTGGMKKYLVIYTGPATALEKSGWSMMDEESCIDRQQAGMRAWGE